MKKFLISISLYGLMCAVLLAVIVLTRILAAQTKLNEVFSISPETKILCIGNSHTGCTWYEAPEFKNRVLWTSGTGFATHYMRFREFERRGLLDSGIKYCILDCDGPGMGGFATESLKERFVYSLPFAWRYARYMPVSIYDLLVYTVSHTSREFAFDETPPKQVPDWTTRTVEEQQSNISAQYGRTTGDWQNGFPKDWQKTFLWMVEDVKKRCENHGIHLICFAAPLTSASPARTNSILWKRESELINRVKSLGIDYYDFRLSCSDNQFRDSHHLLRDSSYEFTKKFFQNVLKIDCSRK